MEDIVGTLTDLVDRVENLPNYLTRIDNVIVNDQLSVISMLASPIVHLSWPISELFFKYRTDFFQATLLPPVDEEFCERALFVYTTEFRLLCRYLFEDLLTCNVNINLSPRFIKVCRRTKHRVQLNSDSLLVAVHNNCVDIRLADKYQVYIDDLCAHALILVQGNGLVGSEIEFIGGDEMSSLFLLFDLVLDETTISTSSTSITEDDKDVENARNVEDVEKDSETRLARWTRCARYIDACEVNQSSGELIAVASVARKLRHTLRLRKRIFDLRHFDNEPTRVLSDTDCDYASTLNMELTSSLKRKHDGGDGDGHDENDKKGKFCCVAEYQEQQPKSSDDDDEQEDEQEDEKEDEQEDDKDEISLCDTIEAANQMPSDSENEDNDEDNDEDNEDDENVRDKDGHPDILSKYIALVHPTISYSSERFFYQTQSYMYNELFNVGFFEAKAPLSKKLLVVASNACVRDFLKTKSTESLGILLDIATKSVYAVPSSGDLLFYKRNQVCSVTNMQQQDTTEPISLHLPRILNSDAYIVVKAPNLIFLEAFWIFNKK